MALTAVQNSCKTSCTIHVGSKNSLARQGRKPYIEDNSRFRRIAITQSRFKSPISTISPNMDPNNITDM